MARIRRLPRRLLAGPAALLAVGIVAFSVFAFTGGPAQGAPAAVSSEPSVVAAGAALYDVHCQSCHGVNGVGGVNGAPQLITAGAAAADFYLSTGRMPLNSPSQQAVRHHPYFSAKQIRELDSYIAALPEINHVTATGPGIPNPLPLCAKSQAADLTPTGCVTLSEGQQLFAINCAQCHQAVGSGGLLSKGYVIPSLRAATAVQAYEAMRVGPRPMPTFGSGQLDRQQASAVAQYVKYLNAPDNHGGLAIGNFGPVPEGFVGIVVGLVLILIASRWIGTRG